MEQGIEAENWTDIDGAPNGGFARVFTPGSMRPVLAITWQQGPLGRGDDRLTPNGVFVETVLVVARQRLAHYQESKFACTENNEAIGHIDAALEAMHDRTRAREARGVEGTLEP